jgi:glycosyltransferase involved in cell wall biosynthesis
LKGILISLKVFQKLQNNNTYLLICGEGDFKQTCEKWVEANNISHVIFAGKVQPSERINYYKRATVFVLPSFSSNGIIEAWGLTVNEALEAGCPVIATDAVGSSYDLLDGKSGIQIESCNVDAVSNAIKNFEVNEDVHIYCKNKAKQYSVEKMAEGFSRIIKKVSDV